MNGSQAYLAAVGRELHCSRKQKQLLLHEFSQNTLSEYTLDYDALCQTIGMPKQVAAELLTCVDPDILRKSKRNKKFLVGAIIAVLLLACIYLGYYFLRASPYVEVDGRFTVITTGAETSDPVEISDEEFEALLQQSKKDENIEKKVFSSVS